MNPTLQLIADCQPFDPTQPTVGIYGFDALRRFRYFKSPTTGSDSRASFKAQYGIDLDNWSSDRPAKYWADLSLKVDPQNLNATVTYPKVLTGFTNSGPVFNTLTLTIVDAMAFNVPGLIAYPAYAPADLKLTGVFLGSPVTMDNPMYFCTPEQAQMLAQEINATGVVQESGQVVWNYPAGDSRRPFDVVFKGTSMNAGNLLATQLYKAGVGHPGSWDLSGTQPIFNPYPDGPDGIHLGVRTDEVPVPIRDYLANEKPYSAGLAMAWEIENTDIVTPPTPGGSGYTDADRKRDAQTYTMLGAIYKALNLPPLG